MMRLLGFAIAFLCLTPSHTARAAAALVRCNADPDHYCQKDDEGRWANQELPLRIFPGGKVGTVQEGKVVISPRHIWEAMGVSYEKWAKETTIPQIAMSVLTAYQDFLRRMIQSNAAPQRIPGASPLPGGHVVEIEQIRPTPVATPAGSAGERPTGASTPETNFVAKCAARLNQNWKSLAPQWLTAGPHAWWRRGRKVRAVGDKVQMSVTLNVNYPGATLAQGVSLRDRLEAVKPCMAGFFARYGILLDLNFRHAPDRDNALGSELDLNVREAGERGATFNASNWAFSLDGSPLTDTCSVFTHEFGHLLGLVDEYPDEIEPNRQLGELDSLMRNCHCRVHDTRFYLRHIRTMLEGAC